MLKIPFFTHKPLRLSLIAVGVCLLLLSGTALAASIANTFILSWWSVDGGGTTSLLSGEYSLGGTSGQPEAASALASGIYILQPGIWSGSSLEVKFYLPIVTR